MILASVPEFDARFGQLFTTIEIAAVIAFALEYAARIWSVVGHSLRDMTPTRARLEYALLQPRHHRSAVVSAGGDCAHRGRPLDAGAVRHAAVHETVCAIRPALRSLLAALHAERRTLFGCVGDPHGAVLLFASLLYAIEHKIQPDKFGTIRRRCGGRS